MCFPSSATLPNTTSATQPLGQKISAHTQQRLLRFAALVLAEVLLNLVNMDAIANYSEFVFGKELQFASPSHAPISLCL
jgi:hypothetical protein